MTKKTKWAVLCLISAVALAMVLLAAGSYFHKPTIDQVDTLQAYIEQRKASADSFHKKTDSANQLYEQDRKNFNLPADSVERESVWSEYFNALRKDTNGKTAP